MKTINEQINPKFVIQAKKLAQYKHLLQQILPIECQNHVEVANIRDQNLMLITDSPVWTTRLRQLSPKILQFIAENTAKIDKKQTIHHVQISTRYHSSSTANQESSAKAARKKPQISEKTAEMLVQSANSIKHQQLKTALLKIASHAGRQTEKDK